MTNTTNFAAKYKPFLKELFNLKEVKVKKIASNGIGIFVFNEVECIIFQNSKSDNAIKIFLDKFRNGSLMLRDFMIVYGNELEKKCFEGGINKLYFDTEEELQGIFTFVRKKYDLLIKDFFERDTKIRVIDNYFEKRREESKNIPSPSVEEMQKKFVKIMEFSRKVKFTSDGEIYLKE